MSTSADGGKAIAVAALEAWQRACDANPSTDPRARFAELEALTHRRFSFAVYRPIAVRTAGYDTFVQVCLVRLAGLHGFRIDGFALDEWVGNRGAFIVKMATDKGNLRCYLVFEVLAGKIVFAKLTFLDVPWARRIIGNE